MPDSDYESGPTVAQNVLAGVDEFVITADSTDVGADFGPFTLGRGLSSYSPSGVLTQTGGLQEAVDYINSLGATARVKLKFKAGPFKLTVPVNTPSGYVPRWEGSGRGFTIIQASGAFTTVDVNGNITLVAKDRATDWTGALITDIDFDTFGKTAYTTIDATGNTVVGTGEGSHRWQIVRCVFKGTGNTWAAVMDANEDATVADCQVNDTPLHWHVPAGHLEIIGGGNNSGLNLRFQTATLSMGSWQGKCIVGTQSGTSRPTLTIIGTQENGGLNTFMFSNQSGGTVRAILIGGRWESDPTSGTTFMFDSNGLPSTQPWDLTTIGNITVINSGAGTLKLFDDTGFVSTPFHVYNNLGTLDVTNGLTLNVKVASIGKGGVTVSAFSIPDGCDYGSWTAGTSTGGIQEAVNDQSARGGGIVALKGGSGVNILATATINIANGVAVISDGVFIKNNGSQTVVVQSDTTSVYSNGRLILFIDGNNVANCVGFKGNSLTDTYLEVFAQNCPSQGILEDTAVLGAVSRGNTGTYRTNNCGTGLQFQGGTGRQLTNSFYPVIECKFCTASGIVFLQNTDHIRVGYAIVTTPTSGTGLNPFTMLQFAPNGATVDNVVNNNVFLSLAFTSNNAGDTNLTGIKVNWSTGNQVLYCGFGKTGSGAPNVRVAVNSNHVNQFFVYDETADRYCYINGQTTATFVISIGGLADPISVQPADPASGVTNTSFVAAGFAQAFTPLRTGRLLIIINGNMKNITATTDGCAVQISVGASALTTGQSAAGTLKGQPQTIATMPVASDNLPFCIAAVVGGNVVGTKIFVDCAFEALVGGTAQVHNVNICVLEV